MSGGRRTTRGPAWAWLLAIALVVLVVQVAIADASPLRFRSTKVMGKVNPNLPWTEPRISVGPHDLRWIVTNSDKSGNEAVVTSSRDGLHWKLATNPPAGQTSATPDVDVVTMHTGRVLASELDDAGINFPTSFTDNRGRTWTQSKGTTQTADQDRQWFAVGPDDPSTHKPRVYLLYHNLFSGQGNHNMFVAASNDGGATFGAPVPTTLPGSDAYADLQCADSGGPSAIWVNWQNGRVYAEWTTRGTPTDAGDTGGCTTAASGQPFEFNIVAATRVWVAQSNDFGLTWSDSLAVDDAKSGQIVSMQVASGGLDRAGNVYVAYPEGPLGRKYPDYSGAGVRYKFAKPTATGSAMKWSAGRTLVPASKTAPGNVLVHMQAGDPGRLITEFWQGQARKGREPVWHMTAAETTNAFAANPHVLHARISKVPTDVGTASELMGACTTQFSVASGIVNGLACGRSPDVWGVTADSHCRANSVWPAVDAPDNPNDTSSNPKRVKGDNPGTWATLQIGGPSLCSRSSGKPLAPRGCPDRYPPHSRFAGKNTVSLKHGNVLILKGRATDNGCHSANLIPGVGRIRAVRVAVAKVRGSHLGRGKKCDFLDPGGSLTGFRSCRDPLFLRAHGKRRWRAHVPFSITLPRGSWRILASAIDSAGNREPISLARSFRLTVR